MVYKITIRMCHPKGMTMCLHVFVILPCPIRRSVEAVSIIPSPQGAHGQIYESFAEALSTNKDAAGKIILRPSCNKNAGRSLFAANKVLPQRMNKSSVFGFRLWRK